MDRITVLSLTGPLKLPNFLTPYLLYIKLGILALIISLIGYSYLWTFNKGLNLGEAKMVTVQAKAMLEFQKNNAAEAAALRERELREARAVFEQENANNIKRIADLKKTNDLLKKEPAAAAVVPPAVISLLNGAGRSTSPKS